MASQVRAAPAPRVITDQLMPDAVFDHHLVPYLSTPLKKEVREVSKDELILQRRWADPRVLSIFEEAHKIAELYFSLASLSACNRYYRDKLKGKKKELADRIIFLLSSFPKVSVRREQQRFSDLIHTSIRTGSHLNLFKIYFYYKPEALHSFSEVFETPLHQAVDGLSLRSPPFIAFILELDKKLVETGSHRSLLLVPNQTLSESLMLESLVKTSYSFISEHRVDHPSFAKFVEEQTQVKAMLAKHALDLGIEDRLIEHAFKKAAEYPNFSRTFHNKDAEEIRDLIRSQKEKLASEQLAPVKTPDKKTDLPKKTEKKQSSWCSRIYKSIMYVVTCQWAADFMRFLKSLFK